MTTVDDRPATPPAEAPRRRPNPVLALLRNLADRFPQVILITHVESVRDAFDRVIRLSYDVENRVTRAVPEPRDVAA